MPTQSGSPFACGAQKTKRSQPACDQKDGLEKARISTHAFIEKGVIAPGLRGAALTTAILAAEANCKGYIIRDASGSYDGGADVTGQSGGRVTEKVINLTHTITGTDPAFVGNEKFWDNMRASQSKYDYFGFTETRCWPVQGVQLAINGKGPIGEDPTQNVQGTFTVVWNRFALVESVEADVEALATIPFLGYEGLVQSTQAGENGATITPTAEYDLVTIAEGETSVISFDFDDPTNATYAIRPVAGGILPPPSVVSFSPASSSGKLSLDPQAGDAGTYQFYVRCETPCGIYGEALVIVEVTE